MTIRIAISLAAALLSGAAGSVVAQKPAKPIKEEKPGLAAQATFPADSARKIALAKVPGGKIAEEEVEMEHGKLVYSYDIKVAGKSGIEEVQVDAKTGAVVSVAHESAASEAKEKQAEKKEPKPKP